MKRLSAISRAAIGGIIASAGLPMQAALSYMFRSSAIKDNREKTPTTAADFAAIEKAEAKRLRRSGGKNKERV